jgi:hypothetical protein
LLTAAYTVDSVQRLMDDVRDLSQKESEVSEVLAAPLSASDEDEVLMELDVFWKQHLQQQQKVEQEQEQQQEKQQQQAQGRLEEEVQLEPDVLDFPAPGTKAAPAGMCVRCEV